MKFYLTVAQIKPESLKTGVQVNTYFFPTYEEALAQCEKWGNAGHTSYIIESYVKVTPKDRPIEIERL